MPFIINNAYIYLFTFVCLPYETGSHTDCPIRAVPSTPLAQYSTVLEFKKVRAQIHCSNKAQTHFVTLSYARARLSLALVYQTL